jgi:CrcB protein
MLADDSYRNQLREESVPFITCLWIIAGGALGTLLRFLLSGLGAGRDETLPWNTLIVNVTGCLIIGFVGTLTLAEGRYPLPENVRLFLMVGFCGGFTTFSAFSLQTLDLLRAGDTWRAATYIGLSVFLCLGAVWLGHDVASRFNDHASRIAQLRIEEDA